MTQWTSNSYRFFYEEWKKLRKSVGSIGTRQFGETASHRIGPKDTVYNNSNVPRFPKWPVTSESVYTPRTTSRRSHASQEKRGVC